LAILFLRSRKIDAESADSSANAVVAENSGTGTPVGISVSSYGALKPSLREMVVPVGAKAWDAPSTDTEKS
jgi:hypothetical protein